MKDLNDKIEHLLFMVNDEFFFAKLVALGSRLELVNKVIWQNLVNQVKIEYTNELSC